MTVGIAFESREDEVRVPPGKLLQYRYQLRMKWNFALFPVLGNESLAGLGSNCEIRLNQVEVRPVQVGEFLFPEACVIERLEKRVPQVPLEV